MKCMKPCCMSILNIFCFCFFTLKGTTFLTKWRETAVLMWFKRYPFLLEISPLNLACHTDRPPHLLTHSPVTSVHSCPHLPHPFSPSPPVNQHKSHLYPCYHADGVGDCAVSQSNFWLWSLGGGEVHGQSTMIKVAVVAQCWASDYLGQVYKTTAKTAVSRCPICRPIGLSTASSVNGHRAT